MNLADEHLLKALVLAPTLLNEIDVMGDLPKCLFFESCYRHKTERLDKDQYATSYEVAQMVFALAEHGTSEEKKQEVVCLGNQILNIMRGNGRRVP